MGQRLAAGVARGGGRRRPARKQDGRRNEKTPLDCVLILLKFEGSFEKWPWLARSRPVMPDPTAEASRADVATLAGHLLVQESYLEIGSEGSYIRR